MTSDDLLSQIQGLQGQYKNLGVTDPSAVYQQFVQKAQGFKPQYDELGRANTAAYSYPAQAMQDYNSQSGNMNGPDAFERLNGLLQGVGQRYETANAVSNGINAQQGNLQGISNSVYNNVSALGTNLQNQINSLLPVYQSQKNYEAQMAQIALQQQQIQAQKDLYSMIYGNQNQSTPSSVLAGNNPGVLGANATSQGVNTSGNTNLLSLPANLGYAGANLLNKLPGMSQAFSTSPVNPFNLQNLSSSPFYRDLYSRFMDAGNNALPGTGNNYNSTIQQLNKMFNIQ